MTMIQETKLRKLLQLLRRPPFSNISSVGAAQVHVDVNGLQRNAANGLQRKVANVPGLSAEELVSLRKDIEQQRAMRGPEAANTVVPHSDVQAKLEHLSKGNVAQTRGGLLGGLGLGAVTGGLGALTAGLARGAENAPSGLVMAIPGALKGYRLGKKLVRDQQVKGLLGDAYAAESGTHVPPPPLEAGFKEVLGELKVAKSRGSLACEDVTRALRELEEGRSFVFKQANYPLTMAEECVLFEELGSTYVGPTKPFSLKIAVEGGLSALKEIGLTATEVQEHYNK